MERVANDFIAFKKMCRNDSSILNKMLLRTLTCFKELEILMERGIMTEDYELIQTHSHKFKSTAAFLGAKSLEKILAEMELDSSNKNRNQIQIFYNLFKKESILFKIEIENEIQNISRT